MQVSSDKVYKTIAGNNIFTRKGAQVQMKEVPALR